jgi:ubiquitin-activating enzyme E1
MEAMGRLVKLRVLIVGMRGLGVETAKNLILAGPAAVTLYDPSIVQIEDLSANFYLSEGDVDDETRADASFTRLKALNSYVNVSVLEKISSPEDLFEYDVVVVTELLPSLGPIGILNEKLRA